MAGTGWAQKQEQLGGEVVVQLKAEIDEWRELAEQLWHRRGEELDEARRLISEHAAHAEDATARRLVDGLRAIVDSPSRTRIASPNELRTRHLQQRSST